MSFKTVLFSIFTLVSTHAVASPLTGTWQGPCEVRGDKSVSFVYEFSDIDAEDNGTLVKFKSYFNTDTNCETLSRNARAAVTYKISASDVEGIYNIDVNHRGTMFYDIFAISEDGNTLSFGDEDSRDPTARPTNLSTSDRVFVRVEQ